MSRGVLSGVVVLMSVAVALLGVAARASPTPRTVARQTRSPGRPAKPRSVRGSITITTSYYPALNAADRFLNDWLTYNGTAGLSLLTTHAKESVPKADVLNPRNPAWQYFTNPQPTHQAFEITLYRQISSRELRFRVWMYAYAMGVRSFPFKRPPGQILTVVEHGSQWQINNLPICPPTDIRA